MTITKIDTTSAPKAPKLLSLNFLMKAIEEGTLQEDDFVELHNALRYLHNSLNNRSMYQSKQQIKRKIMQKMLEEHGMMGEINDAVRNVVVDHDTTDEGE